MFLKTILSYGAAITALLVPFLTSACDQDVPSSQAKDKSRNPVQSGDNHESEQTKDNGHMDIHIGMKLGDFVASDAIIFPKHLFTVRDESGSVKTAVAASFVKSLYDHYFVFADRKLTKVVAPPKTEYEEVDAGLPAPMRVSRPVDPHKLLSVVLESKSMTIEQAYQDQVTALRKGKEKDSPNPALWAAAAAAAAADMATPDPGREEAAGAKETMYLTRTHGLWDLRLGMTADQVTTTLGMKPTGTVEDGSIVYGDDSFTQYNYDRQGNWVVTEFDSGGLLVAIFTNRFVDREILPPQGTWGRKRGKKTGQSRLPPD